MKLALPLVFLVGIALFYSQKGQAPIKPNAKAPDLPIPITEEMLPVIGFKTLKEMELYAVKNSVGRPEIREFQMGGQKIWCIRMHASMGFSTEQILMMKYVSSRYKQFFFMPLSEGDFKVNQEGDSVTISKTNTKLKKLETIATFHKPFEPLSDLITWEER